VPRVQAWRAVTEAEQLGRWYAPSFQWEIPALEVGGRVKFYNAADDILNATIEVVDPPSLFRLRWDAYEGYANVSLVTSFTLAEDNGGTRVTILESGYEAVPEEERQQWLDSTGHGYGMSMENLKAYLEGKPIPHT
jgi:uncharacterized protein YndB with AHSA1/START domain